MKNFLQCADNRCRLGDNGSHMSCLTMLQEQLDAVRDQLLSEENADVKQKVFGAYLEEPERGANMIIAFATDKGLKLDATSDEVIDYVTNLDENEIDIELSPEALAAIAGGFGAVTNG